MTVPVLVVTLHVEELNGAAEDVNDKSGVTGGGVGGVGVGDPPGVGVEVPGVGVDVVFCDVLKSSNLASLCREV